MNFFLKQFCLSSNVKLDNLKKCFFCTSGKRPLKRAILLSSCECHGHLPLQFAREEICDILSLYADNVKDIIFVPYAKNDFDNYTLRIQQAFLPWGYNIVGLHTFKNQEHKVLSEAKAIFVGKGNTFLLLKRLQDNKMIDLIRKRVNEGSLIYIGSSSGTNVATINIHTTNDMPIVYPKTFEGIGIVPFNINPHYINSYADHETYKGETRDQRILKYLEMPHARPVLGLREGSMLKILGKSMMVKGIAGGVLFRKNEVRTEVPVGSEVSFLCNDCESKNNEDINKTT